MSELRTLYRPMGLAEMDLVLQGGCRAFPPRLPEQPIFYPVLNEGYAESITCQWNVNDPFAGYAGFVTAFEMPRAYLGRYEEKIAGSGIGRELWVPAAEMDAFNAQIRGRIRMIKAYYGDSFKGLEPATSALQGKGLEEQFYAFEKLLRTGMDAFGATVAAEQRVVYTQAPYWARPEFETPHLPPATRARVLDAMRAAWARAFPEIALL
ncbi:MAG: hypothetical protein KIS92_14495 [Planctomycetota bacterium]|nr:hypothetical protein [Planctomycetota bacterium]